MKSNLNKTTVIPKLLKMLEERKFATLTSAIQKLEERNVIWPEIQTIKESMQKAANKPKSSTKIYGLSDEVAHRVKTFETNRPELWDKIRNFD